MNLLLKSVARGSTNLTEVPADQTIQNGDFLITSNVPTNIATGNGHDEGTEWSFDFKNHPNWSLFSTDEPITVAKLTLTLSPKNSGLRTDIIQISYGAVGPIDPSLIRAVPVGETRTIEMDLLSLGVSAAEIINVLKSNNGVIPFLYQDDAIISYADLTICQNVRKRSCGCNRLIVEAVSEDTIAAPGNRRANYLLVSVTDADGTPQTHLNKSNFKVDPMIVGAGGALVDITNVRHSSRIDGFYFVDLKPIKRETWKAGVYVLAVAVEDEDRRGQSLTSVLMD